MGGMITLQARILEKTRPAQWLGTCHKLNKAEQEWIFPQGVTIDQIANAFTATTSEGTHFILRDEEYGPRQSEKSTQLLSATREMTMCYKTTKLKWIDILDIAIFEKKQKHHHQEEEESKAGVKVKIVSSSTGFFPATIPLAPFLSMLIFWLPFFDHGANRNHLEEIREKMEKCLNIEIETRGVLPGGVMGWKEFAIVLTIVAIVMTATVLNFFNPYLYLNIIITIFLLILTLHAAVTLWNGVAVCIKQRRG